MLMFLCKAPYNISTYLPNKNIHLYRYNVTFQSVGDAVADIFLKVPIQKIKQQYYKHEHV